MSKNVHFMGIGGSGMSAAAMLAKAQGFNVSGCDLLVHTPYLKKLKNNKIKILKGHNAKHTDGIDILCVTPSVYYQNKDHEEVIAGSKKDLMTWQKFMGKYLQKDKHVICITGTHGKSTTSTMAGLLFEHAGFDPTVQIGATVLEWEANYRVGQSDYFINEADEFYGNFLNYKPDVIVLNNIEYDHPDFFKNEKHVIETFRKFINKLEGSKKTLIFNQNSQGIEKLFKTFSKDINNSLNLIGYSLSTAPLINTIDSYEAVIKKNDNNITIFEVRNKKRGFSGLFELKVPGEYNVENALGVIALGVNENIPSKTIKESLGSFKGSGRRLDLIGERKGVKVYDDYAHHPTAVKKTLGGLRQKYPKNKVICVVEPHMFSRTKLLLNSYKDAFKNADKVIIAPIYKSRDTNTFGVSSNSIVKESAHKDICAINNFKEIAEYIKKTVKKGNVVIVMGAGKSYLLARDILNHL